MAELDIYQDISEMTCTSSQFDKTAISFGNILSLTYSFQNYIGILGAHISFDKEAITPRLIDIEITYANAMCMFSYDQLLAISTQRLFKYMYTNMIICTFAH